MPFDAEFAKFLMSLGVGGIIAGLIFMWYRKDVRAFTDQWQGQSAALIQVVKENTAAITANSELTRASSDLTRTIHAELIESRDMRRRGLLHSRESDEDSPGAGGTSGRHHR